MDPGGLLGCFDYLQEQSNRSVTIQSYFNGFTLTQIKEIVTQVSKFL